MDQTSRALSLLGLAKRAGAVAGGTELVRGLCRSGKACLVLLADDCSENSAKRVRDCCAYYGVQLLEPGVSMQRLGKAIGMREASAAAVGNAGLAGQIASCLSRSEEE